MRTKNVKPFTYGSLYKEDLPDSKIMPLAAGNLIDFNIAGPFQNTRPDIAANQITVYKSGVYQITADVSVILEEEQSAVFNINRLPDGSDPLIGSTFGANGISTGTGIIVQAYLYAGDAIGIYISDMHAHRGKLPRYIRAALTVQLLEY
ncbi:hypothetical protein MLOOGBEN_05690 [Bacillus sp. EB106-08-02-XG196]|jgi:hypothetical protein|uniref:hypothetical protein n=1 Tax=Bacillus sp. EB106-08-02-XG196 TaxID=2737049 RepID=UPI0015C4A101|nr:hypothetical protein [Bacillus sp. EB106-08-02-XG196]NWQ40188.1 hypothetical protein [Bacillus sp. EB106-08-02-XG196]